MNPITQYLGIAKIVAVLALVAALIAGYFTWHNHVFAQGEAATEAKWNADNIKRDKAEKAAVAQRNADNEVLKASQAETNKLITRSKDAELIQTRAAIDSARRLLVGSAICGDGSTSPAETASTSGSNGADPGSRLVRSDVDRDIRALKLTVEEAFATGRACQKFVTSNGLAP